jgi:hypothetical protein
VLSGLVVVSQGAKSTELGEVELGSGGAWRNRPGVIHSILALEDSTILEVSTPEVDDVVRLADRYGRENEPSGSGIVKENTEPADSSAVAGNRRRGADS